MLLSEVEIDVCLYTDLGCTWPDSVCLLLHMQQHFLLMR